MTEYEAKVLDLFSQIAKAVDDYYCIFDDIIDERKKSKLQEVLSQYGIKLNKVVETTNKLLERLDSVFWANIPLENTEEISEEIELISYDNFAARKKFDISKRMKLTTAEDEIKNNIMTDNLIKLANKITAYNKKNPDNKLITFPEAVKKVKKWPKVLPEMVFYPKKI